MAFTSSYAPDIEEDQMFGPIRNALVAGLIAALGLVGVSYATTGSVNPVKIVSPTTADEPSGPTGATGDSGASGPTGPSGDSGPSGPSGSSGATGATGATGEHGPERSTAGCPTGFTGNHGQFVSSQPKGDRSDAAQSDCGKPVNAKQDDTNEAPENEAPESPEVEQHKGGDAHDQNEQHGEGDNGQGHD
jgi:hypothetical protein